MSWACHASISLCHGHSCEGRNPSPNPMPCRRPGRWIPAFARMTGKKGLSGASPPSRLADKSLRHRDLTLSPSFLRRQESIFESHGVSQTRKMDSRIRENDGKEGVVRRVTTVPARRQVAPPPTYRFVTVIPAKPALDLIGGQESIPESHAESQTRKMDSRVRENDGKEGVDLTRHHRPRSPTSRPATDISLCHRHVAPHRHLTLLPSFLRRQESIPEP